MEILVLRSQGWVQVWFDGWTTETICTLQLVVVSMAVELFYYSCFWQRLLHCSMVHVNNVELHYFIALHFSANFHDQVLIISCLSTFLSVKFPLWATLLLYCVHREVRLNDKCTRKHRHWECRIKSSEHLHFPALNLYFWCFLLIYTLIVQMK